MKLFEHLPASWKVTNITSITEINPTRPKNPPDEDELASFVPMKNIEELTGQLDPSVHKKWGEINSGYTRFQEDDVVFAKITPSMENGKAALARNLKNGAAAGTTELHVIRPYKRVKSKYILYYVLQEGFRREAEANMTGTAGQMRVPTEFLESVEIPLPPLAEQKRIITKIEELISKLDSGTKEIQAANTRLKQYKRTILQDAVEGELTKIWRQNHNDTEPADQLLQRTEKLRQKECGGKYGKLIEPTDIPEGIELPKDWTWTSLSQIGEVSRGKSTHRPRDDPSLFGGEYPFIQTGEIRAADTVLNNYEQTYNEKGLEQSRLWPEGTLCITIAANIGETAILGIEACFPDSVVGFLTNPEYCNVRYVELYFRTIQRDLERYAPATAQKNINLGTLSDLPIPLPPVKEQNQIVQQVHSSLSVLTNNMETISNELVRSERLRQSILKQAFRGELVPQSQHDESREIRQERGSSESKPEFQKQATLSEVTNDVE
jgi:type I restriction enzyme S subunit